MMKPHECAECRVQAEAPFTIARDKGFFINGMFIEPREYVWCQECLERMACEREMEQASRRGEVCAFCYQELEPSGGTAIEIPRLLPDDPKLFRVCAECAEYHRRLMDSEHGQK